MAHNSRSGTKRRRAASISHLIVIISPGELSKLSNNQEMFTPHPGFWLDDGDLILPARGAAFRVYQGLLTKKSAVFVDMFAISSADATEKFDACPVVHLSDHPEDLAGYTRRDGSVEHLPADDLRLCISARVEHTKHVARMAMTVFTFRESDGYRTAGKCIIALNDIWGNVELNAPGACDIFNTCDRAIGVRGVCNREMLEREVAERKGVDAIARIFGMTVEECEFTTRDGPS